MIHYTYKQQVAFEIDDEDYESVSNYKWHRTGDGYLQTHILNYYEGIKIGTVTIKLTQFLLGRAPEDLEWDHIDRNKLNNHRNNLRLVTPTINSRNRNAQRNNSTGVKGVCFYPLNSWFIASITTSGKFMRLGQFKTLEEATAARKAAEDKYWGNER